MQKIVKAGLLLLMVVLAACSRVTQENFDKIQPGMTMEQVRQVLGEPTSVESVNIAGIAGAVATWKNRNAVITIHFLNNVVTIKTFVKDANKNGSSSGDDDLTNNSNTSPSQST